MAALPISTITHPLGDQAEEAVRAKAVSVVDAVVRALTTPASKLTDEEPKREYAQPRSVFRSKTIFA